MTVPAPIKQSELQRAARVAREQGCVIEINVGGVVYTIRPDAPKPVDAEREIRL